MSHIYLSALSWLPQDLLHFTSRAIEVHLEWRERAGNTLHSGKAHYSSFHSRPRSGQKNPKQFYNTLFSHSPSLSQVTWIFKRWMSGDLSRYYLSFEDEICWNGVDGICCWYSESWRWWLKVQHRETTGRWIFIMKR